MDERLSLWFLKECLKCGFGDTPIWWIDPRCLFNHIRRIILEWRWGKADFLRYIELKLTAEGLFWTWLNQEERDFVNQMLAKNPRQWTESDRKDIDRFHYGLGHRIEDRRAGRSERYAWTSGSQD